MNVFTDRHEAGKSLAEKLGTMGLEREICVLALPRGGVPVAWEIAQSLHAPLDMLFVKKIGAPGHPEFAIGAVSERSLTWQQQAIEELRLSREQLRDLAEAKQRELKVQLETWRKGRNPIEVRDQTVLVVDDGLATGATMVAALHALRARGPKRIVVAVPVASRSAAETVRGLCDDLVVLQIPQTFFAVGDWYQDFTQVTDRQIEKLLAARGQARATGDTNGECTSRENPRPPARAPDSSPNR